MKNIDLSLYSFSGKKNDAKEEAGEIPREKRKETKKRERRPVLEILSLSEEELAKRREVSLPLYAPEAPATAPALKKAPKLPKAPEIPTAPSVPPAQYVPDVPKRPYR